MAMRWEDERYVRLYTKDTATWKLLCWQAKCLLPLLLRKVDRAGIADIGDDLVEGVAALVDMPPELVVAGLHGDGVRHGLLTREVFVARGPLLVMPNYIEAQEAKQSDAARQRAHRERARDLARAGGVVTKRDETVTTGHALSQPVTPSLAEPSRAVPIGELPAADPPPAVPEEVGDKKNTSGRGARRAAPAQVSFAELEERKAAPEAQKRGRGPALPPWLDADLWEAWRAERKARRKPLTERAEVLQLRELERLREQGQDPKAVVEQSIARSWSGLFPVHKEQARLPARAEEDRPRPPPIEEVMQRQHERELQERTRAGQAQGPKSVGDIVAGLVKKP